MSELVRLRGKIYFTKYILCIGIRLKSVGWICHVGIFQARQNKEAMDELKRQLSAAEKILSKRQIDCIEDLNIGDLSAFMEISVPMECLVGFHWEDYPSLNKLHQVNISNSLHIWTTLRVRPTSCQLCCEVPCFYKVHQPFLDFCRLDNKGGQGKGHQLFDKTTI